MSEILPISSNNLSIAWAAAFLRVIERGVTEITPLVVTVSQKRFDSIDEVEGIRRLLDQRIVDLKRKDSGKFRKLQPCHTVANTIFPDSMCNLTDPDAATNLFARFKKAWPRIKKSPQNHRGSYFRRMTAFRPDEGSEPFNQLEHIINTYRSGNHRRSALQAAVFDPVLDHSNARQQGFPCLHQVAFMPVANQGLAVTGFYATQYLFDRAYGNYLGLCRLGRFMAAQMGLRLVSMTCIASIAQLGTPPKSELATLATELRGLLDGCKRKSS